MRIVKKSEDSLRKHFPNCPLCGKPGLHMTLNYRSNYDDMSCPHCGAKWVICFDTHSQSLESPLKWAKLTKPSNSNLGSELIGKEVDINVWRSYLKPQIGKIRCSYCGCLYNAEENKCPNCSAPH